MILKILFKVRVLLYFDQVTHSDVVVGFVDEFKARGKVNRLADVGYDGGMNDVSSIRETFSKLGVTKNVWLGDGNINCYNEIHPYTRLKEELANRDSDDRFVDNVH